MHPIEKMKIKIRVTTTKHVIEGYLNKMESSRTLDVLNSRDKFIALTDATVCNGECHDRKFVAVNMINVVTVEEI